MSGNAKQRRVFRRHRARRAAALDAALREFYPASQYDEMFWSEDAGLLVFAARVRPTTCFQGRMDVSHLVSPPP